MKKCVLCALFLLAGPLDAREQELDFAWQQSPRYPHSLDESGTSGLATVEFNAHSDGSISDVTVVDSSHWKFARSAVQAVPRWRLTPWRVSDDRPKVILVRHDIYFNHPREASGARGWVSRHVRWSSCAKFNNAFDAFQVLSPGRHWVDMHYFTYTFLTLARAATRQKMTDQQRGEVGDALVAAIPQIVATCKAQPQMRYRDVLPEQLKAML